MTEIARQSKSLRGKQFDDFACFRLYLPNTRETLRKQRTTEDDKAFAAGLHGALCDRATSRICDPEIAMHRSITNRSKGAALLLCALLVVMSIVSPICPTCDGLGSWHSSHAPLAGKQAPPVNDTCNGVCSCCGFHWLPPQQTQLFTVSVVRIVPVLWKEHYPTHYAAPPFLPPRA